MFSNYKINIFKLVSFLSMAVIFLAPIRKLTTLFGFFSIQQFLSIMLVLAFIVAMLKGKLLNHKKFLLFIFFIFIFDSFLYVYHLSTGFPPDLINIFNRYKMWVYSYIVCVINFTDNQEVFFGRTIIFSTFFASILAIINYLLNIESLQILAFWDFRMFRAGSGLEYDTNYFAALICMSIPFHLNSKKYLSNFKFYNKKINTIIILVIFITLFLTLSRGAYLVSGLFIFYYFFKNIKNRNISINNIISSSLIILAIAIFFPTLTAIIFTRFEDITSAFNILDSSLLKRVDSLNSAKVLFANNPIFGVGIGQSALLSGSTGLIDTNRTFDNQYLTILVEQGVIFFLTYYLFLFTNMWRNFKINSSNEFNLSLVAYFIFCFFYNIESLWYFYFLLGIIISQKGKLNESIN